MNFLAIRAKIVGSTKWWASKAAVMQAECAGPLY
jgi:predicted XRE-type DNA-binding protein